VPACAYALFERQARRLDALGDHGEVTTATVTKVEPRGYVSYEYALDGQTHAWSVAQRDAPHAVGERFKILYLPEDLALSRPYVERSRATAEAAANRRFSWKVVLGLATFFGVSLLACELSLRRLRRRGEEVLTDPRAYRTRLVFAFVTLLSFMAVVIGWHTRDALQRGESVGGVVLGGVLSVAVVIGTGVHVLRHGREQAATRSVHLVKWAAPIAAAVAGIRVLVWLAGR
jgi:hypothetical protein